MKRSNIITFTILALIIIAGIILYFYFFNNDPAKVQKDTEIKSNSKTEETAITPKDINQEILEEEISPKQSKLEDKTLEIQAPLSNYLERITKKPFGIYITPSTSPVQPERFEGFHTGTDFEIFQSEENKDVNVKSICEGEIIYKDFVGGYGGVLIQSCQINNQPATVLYGHINIEDSSLNIGNIIIGGTNIAPLADNDSYYSGNERKHLHLGIHKGKDVELKGYVSSESGLSNWIDFESI